MGGCRALPRSCAPPDPYTFSSDEQINAQVVERFIEQVWNYRWQPGDEYYFLPPGLRTALGTFLDPNYVRYRGTQTVAGQLGVLKRGCGPYGLGRCVKRVHEVAPDLVVSITDLIAQGDRVMAVLTLDSAKPPVGPKPFRAIASVMYRLAGPSNSRKIVEDWAASEPAFLE